MSILQDFPSTVYLFKLFQDFALFPDNSMGGNSKKSQQNYYIRLKDSITLFEKTRDGK